MQWAFWAYPVPATDCAGVAPVDLITSRRPDADVTITESISNRKRALALSVKVELDTP